MPNIAQDLQTDTLSESGALQWEELTPGNWRLPLGLFGTIILFSDGSWVFIGRGDAMKTYKSATVEAAKQEAALLVRLELDKLISKLEQL